MTFPLVPGFEGSGEIVAVGRRIDKSNIGKRVCLVQNTLATSGFQGMWGQYTYAKFKNLMVFNDTISYEKIAFSIVNPMTVCGFLDIIRKSKTKAFVQTFASSSVGKKMFLTVLAKEKDVKVINIVSRDDEVRILKELGAEYIINSSQENWMSELRRLSLELESKICFDCVGGDLEKKILNAMPYGSTLYHYGNLWIQPDDGFDIEDLIFKNKNIYGWWLGPWLRQLSEKERSYWFDFVTKEIESGSELFKTTTSNNYGLKNIQEAVEFYKKNMKQGKILILPNN
jgi:NADPH:quinone reductase-like Zn-dependent oxidoreductase